MEKTKINVNNLDSAQGFAITPGNLDEFRGTQAIGDINGDGFADVAVQSSQYPGDGSGEIDSVYVVLGNENVASSGSVNVSDLNGQNGFEMTFSDSSFDGIYYGGMKTLGDINGDGNADFAVHLNQSEDSTQGRFIDKSLIVFGDDNIGSSGTVDINDINAANTVSGELELIGDINGDGASEFLIENYDGVKYYMGSNDSVLDTSKSFEIVNPVTRGGGNISSAGDINGDGINDLFIRDNGRFNSSRKTKGVGHVVFGGADVGANGEIDVSNLDGDNGFSFKYGSGNWLSIPSIDEVGDLNGDGFNEVAVNIRNKYFVLYGKESGFDANVNLKKLDAKDGFTINGSKVDQFGLGEKSISSAGDFNGDGMGDVAISSSFAEKTYVVYGGQELGANNKIDLHRLDSNSGTIIKNAGEGVQLAGDVNGDGASDLLVQGMDSAYVLYGSSSNDSMAATSELLGGQDEFQALAISQGTDANPLSTDFS